MRLLIDTHALLWWLSDDPSLSDAARETMAETANVLLVSAASAWEIATKVRLGRLPGAAELAADFEGFMLREGFTTLILRPNTASAPVCCPALTKTRSTAC